jgi:hypothetical protein
MGGWRIRRTAGGASDGSGRKAVTQQKILGASMLLFATRGYH